MTSNRYISVEARRERAARVNELLVVIASVGRRFFRYENAVGYLDVDDRGRVWYVNEYNGARIFTHHNGRWTRFHHGGTLKQLVQALRDFVMRGRRVPSCHLGPWASWVNGGDLWGYKEDMEKVRYHAARLEIME